MRHLRSMMILMAFAFCGSANLVAQEMALPKPPPELDVYKSDLGAWDVEIKTWQSPGEPSVTKGKETNRMLGGFWLLTEFQGNMMGLDFEGRGIYSYDAQKKQYFGTWVDSLSSNKMEMTGKYDKEKQTMTYEGTAPGPDGKPAKHVLTTRYKADGNRTLTMHMKAGDSMMKIFEMSYTKAK